MKIRGLQMSLHLSHMLADTVQNQGDVAEITQHYMEMIAPADYALKYLTKTFQTSLHLANCMTMDCVDVCDGH